jgi:hypothetical protein
MRLRQKLCAVVSAAILSATPGVAATVSGTVTDTQEEPVTGATVTFADETNPARLFSDRTGPDGSYRLDLQATTAVESSQPQPATFDLSPNYPNPFNPSTLIPYQVGAAAHVRLRVYNLLGQPIRTLVDRVQQAGPQVIEWDGRLDDGTGAGAGIYVVRMQSPGFSQAQKMLMLDGAGTGAGHPSAPKMAAALQPEKTDLYTVEINGDNLEPFTHTGISVQTDTSLDFRVTRRAPPPIVVEAGGDIAAALKRAGPGDTVLLSAGTYNGQHIDLKQDVIIRGEDASRTILVGGWVRASKLSGAALEHVTISGSGDDSTPTIAVYGAEVALRHCRIEANPAFCAVLVEGADARVTLETSWLKGNRGIGIWVRNNAWALIDRNTITENAKGSEVEAILLSGAGTRAEVRGNTIRANKGAGLVVEQGAGAEISGNTFTDNARRTASPQIDIRDIGTAPTLAGNTLNGRGIWVRDGAAGRITDNSVEAPNGIALELKGTATGPAVRDNTIQGSIQIYDQAAGEVVGNTIGGRQNGIEISGPGTRPIVRANTLNGEGNGTVGIQVGDGAAGEISTNTITGYGTGIQTIGTPDATIDIRDNILLDNTRDRRQANPDIVWMDRFARGQQDLKDGLFAKAEETFRLTSVQAPYPVFETQARYYLGVTLMRMGRFDEAATVFTQVLDLDPNHATARWNLRIACRQAGLDPDALENRYRIDLAPSIPPGHEPVRFTDVAREAGVARVSMGRGSAWRDLDGDGWLDLFAVEDGEPHALYHNNGDGTFAEITATVGLDDPRGGWSALWADYDNDGAADIFVTRDGFQGLGANSLYHNNSGAFTDVTQKAGMDRIADSFCATWGDYDGDGWLDLYVGNGIATKGNTNTLYRNNRDGTFADVTEAAGVGDGRRATIGATWGDYDNDGRLDLYVVNNGGACALYRNNGDGTFADVTEAAGVIGPLFGFVAFFLDFDDDGWLDLFVSSSAQTIGEVIDSAVTGKASLFSGNRAYLYRNNGDGTFTDTAQPAGLGRSLGTMAATHGDIDNDGYQDLYLANGGPAMDRFEPDLLFLNNQDGTFADISGAAGLEVFGKGHGTTMADYDNDGDLDIYSPQGGVGGNAGQAQANHLFRNEGNDNHWLIVELVGKATSGGSPPASNRDGIGAKVTVKIGAAIRCAEISGGSGFGVTNSLPMEFGLGSAQRADEIEVRWPSGRIDRMTDVPADQTLIIVEGMTGL